MGPAIQDGNQALTLLNVIQSSLRVSKRHHFFHWAQDELQKLLPHRALLCCLFAQNGSCVNVQQFAWQEFIRESHLSRSLRNGSGAFADLLNEWRAAPGPVCLELSDADGEFLDEAFAHGAARVAVHGVRGVDGVPLSVFFLLGISGSGEHAQLMELLVPHMHAALVRSVYLYAEPAIFAPPRQITEREREVLQLISTGKTNPEIAQILGLSHYTVKNHIKNIFKKLNTSNRSQTVALAMAQNLLS